MYSSIANYGGVIFTRRAEGQVLNLDISGFATPKAGSLPSFPIPLKFLLDPWGPTREVAPRRPWDGYGMTCALGRAVLEPDQLWGL